MSESIRRSMIDRVDTSQLMGMVCTATDLRRERERERERLAIERMGNYRSHVLCDLFSQLCRVVGRERAEAYVVAIDKRCGICLAVDIEAALAHAMRGEQLPA